MTPALDYGEVKHSVLKTYSWNPVDMVEKVPLGKDSVKVCQVTVGLKLPGVDFTKS